MIAVRNRGGAASDVRVCDRLPDGLVFVRARGASFVRGDACWTIASLPAGGVRIFTVRVRPSSVVRRVVVTNVVVVEGGGSCAARTLQSGSQARAGCVAADRARVVVLPARAPGRAVSRASVLVALLALGLTVAPAAGGKEHTARSPHARRGLDRPRRPPDRRP